MRIPPFIRRPFTAAWNALGAVFRVGDAVLHDEPVLTTAEEFSHRIGTCARCEFRDGSSCSVCTCFVDTKAHFKTETCPKGKWTQSQSK